VDILFKSGRLERLCNQERVAKKELGAQGARKLRARLADLDAAANMAEVRFGRPHPLKGDMAGCMALDLDGGRRLVVEAANDPVPIDDTGAVNWAAVDVVCVVQIGDYHD